MTIELASERRWTSSFRLGLSVLAEGLIRERHRWPLWLPVAMGGGVASYFALDREPSGFAAMFCVLVFIAAAAGAFLSAHVWLRVGLSLIAACTLGFAGAKAREAMVAAPVIARPLAAHLTGRHAALDWGAKGVRLVIDEVRSGRLSRPPRRIRILVRRGGEALPIGQGVELSALLMPPPGPAAPGDRDFARAAFFAGIGAVGFAYGEVRPVPLAHVPSLLTSLSAWLERLRKHMTLRIRGQMPPSQGAIATAIITGERGGIAPEDEAGLRDAGLAHVLAIAGLHMALVGAGLFWLVRAALALFPPIALAYPIKKWAALAALAASAFYLAISGAATPATRAFVMLAMMFLAILLDRPALSMRSLALAAVILLLMRPETITEPGFQMSFAAVSSLIAVAEWERGRDRVTHRSWAWGHVRGIALTSLVASFATLPFAMFHFGRATHY
ncbi:MAG: ComEC/Rec2 family competence protein, partial [Rhizomicrobium sp.]